MTNEDEKDPRDAYALGELIGIGSFGAVYKAFFLRGGDDDDDDGEENDDFIGDETMTMFGNENEREKRLRRRGHSRAIKILPFVENNAGNNNNNTLASSSENNNNNNNNNEREFILSNQKRREEIEKEIRVLELCDHPNVTKYHQSFVTPNLAQVWIVMEYCGGGCVRDALNARTEGFREDVIAYVCDCALSGLQYLHEHGRIHRDIKCGNILLTRDGEVKLGDFGVATQLQEGANERAKTFVGTPHWMAPEVISSEGGGSGGDGSGGQKEREGGKKNKKNDGASKSASASAGQGYDGKADVWALGISAIEMAEMHPPRHDVHPMRVIFQIAVDASPELKHRDEWSLAFHDFIAQALKRDPRGRASAQALRRHEFFKNAKRRRGEGDWRAARRILAEELIPLGILHKKEKLEEKYGGLDPKDDAYLALFMKGALSGGGHRHSHYSNRGSSDHSSSGTLRKSNSGSDIRDYGTMIYRSNRSVGSLGRGVKEDKLSKKNASASLPPEHLHGVNKTSAEILSAALNDPSILDVVNKDSSSKEGTSSASTEEQIQLKSGLPIEDLQRMVLGRDENEDRDREKLRAKAVKNFQRDALLRECLEFARTKKTMDLGVHDVKPFASVASAARQFFNQFGLDDSDDDAENDDVDEETKRQNRQRKDETAAKRLLDRALEIEAELAERSPFDF